MHDVWYVFGAAGVVVAAFLFWNFALKPEARLRRRLRKTHSRIVSKARRPTVRFSVRLPRKNRK
jgi:cytochrome c biogenesis protein CcdA